MFADFSNSFIALPQIAFLQLLFVLVMIVKYKGFLLCAIAFASFLLHLRDEEKP